MPYVSPDLRPSLDSGVRVPQTPGELNYVITRAVVRYISQFGPTYNGSFAAVSGVLCDVSTELYRRVVVPYENGKKGENGDVYQLLVGPGG